MELFGAIVLVILMIVFSPFLYFAAGWVTGHFIKWIFGATFISGLTLLGINIAPDSIPLFCGVLGVIGSFFRSVNTSKKD